MTTILFLLVCVVFLAIGLWAGRRHAQSAGDTSSLMIAQRQLPLWMACLTLSATWIGGGYINGTAEAIYDRSRGLVWCQAPWAYALSLIVGGLVFARPMRDRGYRTMLDLFEHRFGARVAALLFVPALIGDLFWTSAILSALGASLGKLFDVDTTFAICLSTTVVVTYTVWGGLWSVACSDAVQLGCIVVGLAITLPSALALGGGWEHISSHYLAQFGDSARLVPAASAWFGRDPWGWQWLDAALLLILGGIPWQVYFQRILACRTSQAAVGMSILAGLICMLVAVAPAILGAVGTCVDWQALGAPAPPAAEVLPHLLRFGLPTVVSLLGLLAIIAAVMSSMDSSILSSASLFAWNVYRPLANVHQDDPTIQRVLRIAIVVVGCCAVTLALNVTSVYELWFLSSDLVYVILFPQLVTALFCQRVNRQGAMAGVVVATSLRAIIFLANTAWGQAVLTRSLPVEPWNRLPWLTLAMLTSWATILLVSRWCGAGWEAVEAAADRDLGAGGGRGHQGTLY